jgi:uncharacterized protein with HEPN domain
MDEKNTRIITKIIEYAEKVLHYCKDVNEDTFTSDVKLVEACVFNLIQIGELARRFDTEFLEKHKDIPWNQIRGLRNRIVHDYEGIDLLLIWDIINGDEGGLTELINKLKKLLNQVKPEK